jgi:hypothetical protein
VACISWYSVVVVPPGHGAAPDLTVDTFPSPSGGGNAVRLPGRHHRRTDQWTEAWTGGGWAAWPAALDRLAALPPVPASHFPDPGPTGPPAGPAARGDRPGDVFNLLVPVEDVLARYGWCPPIPTVRKNLRMRTAGLCGPAGWCGRVAGPEMSGRQTIVPVSRPRWSYW